MSVNGFRWREGDGSGDSAHTAEERAVTPWTGPEYIYILCGGDKRKGEVGRAEMEELTSETLGEE